MKKKINSLDDFKEEKRRVRRRLRELEVLIEEDVSLLKENLRPWRLAGTTLKSIFITEQNGVVGETIGLTVNGLIKKLLLRRSNWLIKFIVAYMVKNYARNLVLKNSSNILEWVKRKFVKMSTNHHGEEKEATV